MPDHTVKIENLAMYFAETGEFWCIHGTAIFVNDRGDKWFDLNGALRYWSRSLQRALSLFIAFDATAGSRVEVGVTNVKGAQLSSESSTAFRSPAARKNEFVFQSQQRDWSAPAQYDFLHQAHNELLDMFSLSEVDLEATLRIVKHDH